MDDSVEIVEAARAIFEARGFEVDRATNPFAGIRLAVLRPPDAIVMDLDMPGMDGLEAAAHLKRIDEVRHVPVIAFTGQPLESITLHASRPFSRIVSKASGFGALEREIDQLLNSPAEPSSDRRP